jgi:uncharacterized membrane protein
VTRPLFYFLLLLISSCTLPDEKKLDAVLQPVDTTSIQSNDTNTAQSDTLSAPLLPPVKKIKRPKGIYRAILPLNGKMEQIVAFYNDYTFQLQEKYTGTKKDSIVTVRGNWSPSDGYIWLYHDQVVRGRYTWQGDTLQYYSPASKKSYSMHALQDVMDNTAWQTKKQEGILLYGVGTEPFWSIEYNNKDSLSFQLADWTQPVRMKLAEKNNTPDSVSYSALQDSIPLRVTVYPYFCNDGMSDFVYRNKIRVQYKGQVYNGCGVLYK